MLDRNCLDARVERLSNASAKNDKTARLAMAGEKCLQAGDLSRRDVTACFAFDREQLSAGVDHYVDFSTAISAKS